MKRIKSDALKTRDDILDAAERLFYRRGMSRPTLEEIAHEAGVTRGAIYWHFKNKCEVFAAMCERVELPIESVFGGTCSDTGATPLRTLHDLIERLIVDTLSDSHERTVFEIVTYKCELVDENEAVLRRCAHAQRDSLRCIHDFLDSAVRLGELPADTDTAFAASMVHGFICGALDNCLHRTDPPNIQSEAERIAALAIELPARCLKKMDDTQIASPNDEMRNDSASNGRQSFRG